MSEKPEALADRLDDERMNLIERLTAENERLRDELRQSSIDTTRAEIERLREALRACFAHWLKDDDPDELQENVAKFKELCGWEDKR